MKTKTQGKELILLSVSADDLTNGVFENNEITELADGCFYGMPKLIKVILPKVKKCGNHCFSSNDKATFNVPLLATCGNDCFRYNGSATFNVPLLATCGNHCFSSNVSATTFNVPLLATCGNYCFRYNGKAPTFNVPLLATCGNDCFRYNGSATTFNVPLLATCGNHCFYSNDKATTILIGNYTLSHKCVDGYPFIIENAKTNKDIKIYSGYNFVSMNNNVIGKQPCYVAEKEKFTAHGDTVKKAIRDLQFKIVSEKLKNEPITPDTIMTVRHYRLVTGSCDIGVRDWLQRNGIPYEVLNKGNADEETVVTQKLKAKDILPLLKKTNAYGVEKFTQLYKD